MPAKIILQAALSSHCEDIFHGQWLMICGLGVRPAYLLFFFDIIKIHRVGMY